MEEAPFTLVGQRTKGRKKADIKLRDKVHHEPASSSPKDTTTVYKTIPSDSTGFSYKVATHTKKKGNKGGLRLADEGVEDKSAVVEDLIAQLQQIRYAVSVD